MKTIAITGSVCSGKTFVSKLLHDSGVPVHSSDEAIQKAWQEKSQDKQAAWNLFIKNNKEWRNLQKELRAFEESSRKRFLQKHASSELVVFDIPLIFELSTNGCYDFILLTSAPKGVRAKRAVQRGMPLPKFFLFDQRQTPYSTKIHHVDHIINTSATCAQVKEQLNDCLSNLGLSILS